MKINKAPFRPLSVEGLFNHQKTPLIVLVSQQAPTFNYNGYGQALEAYRAGLMRKNYRCLTIMPSGSADDMTRQNLTRDKQLPDIPLNVSGLLYGVGNRYDKELVASPYYDEYGPVVTIHAKDQHGSDPLAPEVGMGGNRAQEVGMGGNRAPEVGISGNRAPESGMGGNRASEVGTVGNRGPEVGMGGNRAPEVGMGGNRGPEVGMGGNRPPGVGMGGTRAPEVGMGGNRAPEAGMGGNREPEVG